MYKNMKKRRTLEYKMKLWFYKVTFRDVIDYVKAVLPFMVEIVMCALFLGLIFVVPALFH